MYKITANDALSMLRFDLGGFWDEAQVIAFKRDTEAAVRALSRPKNRHVALADASNCNLQSQPIVEMFKSLIADPPIKAAKIALFSENPLARMQLKRLSSHPDVRVFVQESEAMVWLME